MAEFSFQGKTYHTLGEAPEVGTRAPDFTMTKDDLSEIRLSDCYGKVTILNVFPSLDTPTCAKTIKRFNHIAKIYPKTLVLCVSADLPFAQQRFCASKRCGNIIPVSTFRNTEFGTLYGLKIIDGPLEGLLARAVIVLNADGKVLSRQFINVMEQEPDYSVILESLDKAKLNI